MAPFLKSASLSGDVPAALKSAGVTITAYSRGRRLDSLFSAACVELDTALRRSVRSTLHLLASQGNVRAASLLARSTGFLNSAPRRIHTPLERAMNRAWQSAIGAERPAFDPPECSLCGLEASLDPDPQIRFVEGWRFEWPKRGGLKLRKAQPTVTVPSLSLSWMAGLLERVNSDGDIAASLRACEVSIVDYQRAREADPLFDDEMADLEFALRESIVTSLILQASTGNVRAASLLDRTLGTMADDSAYEWQRDNPADWMPCWILAQMIRVELESTGETPPEFDPVVCQWCHQSGLMADEPGTVVRYQHGFARRIPERFEDDPALEVPGGSRG